jgi:hypothetical protein
MTVREAGTNFWDWVDNRTVFRRLVVGFTLYLTYDAIIRCTAFAYASKFDGVGTSMVIAAILVPLGAVQKFAFDLYNGAREGK